MKNYKKFKKKIKKELLKNLFYKGIGFRQYY